MEDDDGVYLLTTNVRIFHLDLDQGVLSWMLWWEHNSRLKKNTFSKEALLQTIFNSTFTIFHEQKFRKPPKRRGEEEVIHIWDTHAVLFLEEQAVAGPAGTRAAGPDSS